MPVDKKLMEILCCPVSKVPVTPMTSSSLERLNRAIEQGEVKYVDGDPLDQVMQEALITEDRKVIYEVRDDIPILLPERGVGTAQLESI
ncbi:MAG: hypothetical protein QNJ40_07645 [Xanthomonadales bacterium]|nr:hypothetical protein [Xanthomonadales bacterium]